MIRAFVIFFLILNLVSTSSYSQETKDTLIYLGEKPYCINTEGAEKYLTIKLYKQKKKFEYKLEFYSIDYLNFRIIYKGEFVQMGDTLILFNAKIKEYKTEKKDQIKVDTTKNEFKKFLNRFVEMDLIITPQKKYLVKGDELIPLTSSNEMIIPKRIKPEN